MMTCVPRPFGRGSVCSGYCHVSTADRFTLARNAAACFTFSESTMPRFPRGPGRSFCGRCGCRPAARDIAGGADSERVVTRREPIGRETVAPLFVADDRGGDRGAVHPGGHQHAFHGAFLR